MEPELLWDLEKYVLYIYTAFKCTWESHIFHITLCQGFKWETKLGRGLKKKKKKNCEL